MELEGEEVEEEEEEDTEDTDHLEATASLEIMMVVLEQQGDGTMTTTVGHVDMI